MISTIVYTLAALSAMVARASGSSTNNFTWSGIEASKSLEFHKCFGNHECARLDVPMDWNSTVENGSRVAVAIIKIPAKVPVTDKRYGGAILLNPGGPGGSGVSIVFRLGERIQRVVDAAVDPTKLDGKIGDKYFDILSFDPRGVNNTTPQLICFPDSYSAQSWAQALSTEGTVGSSEIAFATKWARYVAVTGSCTERMDAVSRGGENLLEHMNTAPVVADMVAIIEALGEWREKEALRLLDSPVESDMSIGAPSKYASSQSQDVLKSMDYTQSRADIIERTKWNKGHEKLLYWGLSYGSVLGATFAAMQPHRVERVIIDGVVDGEDYYSAEFKLNLNDAEDVFSQFFHFCATAGPSACPFADQGETAEMLRKKFDSILAELINQPISVLPNSEKDFSIPDIITSSDLLRYIHRSLYSPLKLWPDLAKILHELQHRNGTSFTTIRNESRSSKRNDRCPACDEPYSAGCQGSTLGDDLEISFAIWCTDGAPAQLAPEEFKNTTLKHLRNQSIHFGDIWSELRMQCVGWKVRPKWNYKGTFRGIETSYPLLIIGTTGDPVCPMVNSHTMARSFIDSVALEQKSVGHCSLSSPSRCTASYVRLYFQTGELPHAGTKCGVDQLPFEPSKDIDSMELNEEAKDLWEAIRDFDGLY